MTITTDENQVISAKTGKGTKIEGGMTAARGGDTVVIETTARGVTDTDGLPNEEVKGDRGQDLKIGIKDNRIGKKLGNEQRRGMMEGSDGIHRPKRKTNKRRS